ncbi:hypothetical protein [Methylobacterium sp. CM6244]
MDTDIPRIQSVSVTGPASLRVAWDAAPDDVVDLSGWVGAGSAAIAPLRDAAVFQTARVSEYRDAVEWGDPDGDLAIDAEHLRRIADEQRPFQTQDLAEWQNAASVSNNEAADFLGVALSTFNAYKAGAAIPRSVQMICRASLRDPVILHAHYRPRVSGRPRRVLRVD